MPKVGDKVRFHFIHTHTPCEKDGQVVGYDPVWRVRDGVVVAVNADPPSVDLDVTFAAEDFEDGSSPAKRQSYVREAQGEPQSGEYTVTQ